MMVRFLAISILLLPIVTASGDEFWDDVDMMYNDLSDPEDKLTQATYDDLSDPKELPTQSKTSEAYLEQSMSYYPRKNPSSNNGNEETPLKRQDFSTRRFRTKLVTLSPEIVESFKQSLIIVEPPSQNISHKILEDKLQALGRIHNWYELITYEVEMYPQYWGKVCATFWNKTLDGTHRVACMVSRSYASKKKRIYMIRHKKQYFDLLYCRCHTFLTKKKFPLCTSETFLIHKGNNNEFFIFEENQSKGNLSIKGFKDGITLPNTSASERRSKLGGKFMWKMVTLDVYEIETFNRALTINTSYPHNVSMEELEDKLMELEEIHEWPDLLKYDYEIYSKYWAKVCVYFWGKQLDRSHRQSCVLIPSLGENKLRKLFLQNRTQHFDLLWCKCHSYIRSYRIPASNVDKFLIHRSSDNEFFVFDQHATELCKYTLFIKDFKGGITLPDPDKFN